MSGVTLIRAVSTQPVSSGEQSEQAGHSVLYVAVRSIDAVALIAGITGESNFTDLDTREWGVLRVPGLARLVAQVLGGEQPKAVTFIGTITHGTWVSWYPPGSAPPVPEEDR